MSRWRICPIRLPMPRHSIDLLGKRDGLLTGGGTACHVPEALPASWPTLLKTRSSR
jgi:hypothetical protein